MYGGWGRGGGLIKFSLMFVTLRPFPASDSMSSMVIRINVGNKADSNNNRRKFGSRIG